MTAGNALGYWLDRSRIPFKTRSRLRFFTITILQGAWWTWTIVLVTRFRHTEREHDWSSHSFGHSFAVFVFLTAGIQLNHTFCYFLMGQIAKDEGEIIKYAALLRGTESAWQAVSYELNAIHIFASVGGVHLNFGL